MKRAYQLFASTAPGLEPFAETELNALGAGHVRVVPGGVELSADRGLIVRLLLELRTVSHLLLRVATFRAEHFERLEREIRKIDWAKWLVPGVPIEVRATAEKSRLHHTGAITERLERWIPEELGVASTGEGEPLRIAARFVHDEVTISIDLSGEPLHRRGYRLDPGKAPLREDLAAALLIASDWDRVSPLIDPMCGSGTIVIEAARMAANIPPGIARRFAIERTRLGAPSDIERARRDAESRKTSAAVIIRASDRDARAVQRTLENAARAGVTITSEVAPLSSVAIDDLVGKHTTVVTNPPWGERLEEAGAGHDRLLGSLGALVRRMGAGSRLAILASDPRLARSVGLPLRTAFLTDAGGTKVRALVSDERER